MFNWLKNKLNFLIPSDIEKGLMTSCYKNIKLGDKLTVPTNVVCFLSFKDKVYLTLQEGTHSLNKDLLLKLYEKQLGKKKSLKHIKVDLFFVNKKTFNFNLNYFDKISVQKKMEKVLFDISMQINVANENTFSRFVMAEFALMTSLQTNDFILDYTEQCLKKFFLRKNLDDLIIAFSERDQITEYLHKSLEKIGITLQDINLELTKGFKTKKSSACVSSFNFNNSTKSTNSTEAQNFSSETIDQTNHLDYNNEQLDVCPTCKSKKIKGSVYCHKCGTKLN